MPYASVTEDSDTTALDSPLLYHEGRREKWRTRSVCPHGPGIQTANRHQLDAQLSDSPNSFSWSMSKVYQRKNVR